MIHVLLCALLSLTVSDLEAGEQLHHWYGRKAEGWFWKDEKNDGEAIAPLPESTPSLPAIPSPPKNPEDQPLTAAWFRKHLGEVRDQALDDPSPDKVRRFFLLQKTLLDKAETFAQTARSIVLADPYLNERSGHQNGLAGSNPEADARGQSRDLALGQIAQKSGLLFVVRSDCPYCHRMAPLISALSSRFGFHLITLSLDGKPLSGLPADTFRHDPGFAERHGIRVTPVLYLMKVPDAVEPVMEGSGTLLDLEERLIAAGYRLSLIDQDLERKASGQHPLALTPNALLNDPQPVVDLLP